jgi:hypothetical protein
LWILKRRRKKLETSPKKAAYLNRKVIIKLKAIAVREGEQRERERGNEP